jgi:hypothetical protein
MDFEWDESKREKIKRDRDIDILDAALIFAGGMVIQWRDNRQDYREERFLAAGVVGAAAYVVVYVRRGDVFRLITAWRISHAKFKKYQARYARPAESDEVGR